MTITQAVLGFAAVAALLTIIPGIDTTLVLRTTLVRGRAHGFAAMFGIVTGCLVWGVAAAVGAAALLAGVHALLGIVWLGAIIFGASAARRWIANDRALRIIDRIAGTVLVAFGAKLAWDARW